MKCVCMPLSAQQFNFRLLFAVLLFSIFFSGRLLAVINLDYQTFRSNDPGEEVVDIYFSLANTQLVFLAENPHFAAQVDVTVFIKDRQGHLIAQKSSQHRFTCADFEETINASKINLFRFSFHLPPGKYKAYLQISDRNKTEVLKRAMSLLVPDYHSAGLQISSLVLKTDGVAQVSPLFDYHNPLVDVYFETYNAAGKILRSEICFINAAGQKIKSIKGAMRYQGNSEGFTAKLSLFDLAPGKYTLQLIQTGDGQRAVSQKGIIIRQSPIDLRFKSFMQIVSEMRYIASEKELGKLEKTASARQQAVINAFWESRDPTPGTAKNEAMEEYYHRIEVANTLFSKNNILGWQTDRGMIYILFGKPDVILRETSDGFHAYRQDWIYKKLRLNFTFIAWRWFEDFQLLDRSYVVANYLP